MFLELAGMFAHLNTKSRNHQHLCQLSNSYKVTLGRGMTGYFSGAQTSWELCDGTSIYFTRFLQLQLVAPPTQLMMSCHWTGCSSFVAFEFSEWFSLSSFYLSVFEAQYKSIIWSLVKVFFFSPNLFQVLFLLMVGYTGVGSCNVSLISSASTGLISSVLS